MRLDTKTIIGMNNNKDILESMKEDILINHTQTIRDVLYSVADGNTNLNYFKNRKDVKELIDNGKVMMNGFDWDCNEPIQQGGIHIIKLLYKKPKIVIVRVPYYENNMSLFDKIKYRLDQILLFSYDKDINCLYLPLIIYPKKIISMVDKEFGFINDQRKEIVLSLINKYARRIKAKAKSYMS